MISFLKKIWADPVGSKIISNFIWYGFVITLLVPFFSTTDFTSYISYFTHDVVLPYWLLCLIILASIFTTKYFPLLFKKKRTQTVEEYFDKEYERFSALPTWKHFEYITERINRRMYLENTKINQDIINYYVAENVIFDSQPGYGGYYLFTPKGLHFFNRWSIEKINGTKPKTKRKNGGKI